MARAIQNIFDQLFYVFFCFWQGDFKLFLSLPTHCSNLRSEAFCFSTSAFSAAAFSAAALSAAAFWAAASLTASAALFSAAFLVASALAAAALAWSIPASTLASPSLPSAWRPWTTLEAPSLSPSTWAVSCADAAIWAAASSAYIFLC